MLILSREPGASIVAVSATASHLITLLKILPDRPAISILIVETTTARPGRFHTRTAEIDLNATLKVNDDIGLTLVDFRRDKVRLGIDVPREWQLFRQEIYEVFQGKLLGGMDDPDTGAAGSPVPKTPPPQPPSRDVRLNEPDSEN